MKKNKTPQRKQGFPGRVRIISGELRGRVITLPEQHKIRPTTNVNRESLFNWLGHDILAANCLDLFAGSGALGIEALSRGARMVTFVDSDALVLKNISAHLKKFFKDKNSDAFSQCVFLSIPAASIPLSARTTYDIIFVDPPFYQGLAPLSLRWLEQQHLVKQDSLVFVEVEANEPLCELGSKWDMVKQNLRSSVYAYLLRYKG